MPTNTPAADRVVVKVVYHPRAPQTLANFMLWNSLYALLGLGSMIAFGWVAHQVLGQPFLDGLARTEASLYGMMLAGLSIGLYTILTMGFSSTRSSVSSPIRAVIIAAWFIPTIPGPIGESISPAAYVLLSVLS